MLPAAFSHRSEAQRTEAYASPLRSLRPCWTAFLSVLLEGLCREFDESEGVKVLVQPLLVHQFGMGAGFHEAAFVEDKDPIGSLNRRQAVSNHKGRSSFHELLQCLLDESFGLTVQGGSGFI
jgi:hypothetical protein